MLHKPQKPLKQLVAEFNAAVDANDFDTLYAVEKQLDKVVHKRLRRMRYNDYPLIDLQKLCEQLPADYATKASDTLYKLTMEREAATGLPLR